MGSPRAALCHTIISPAPSSISSGGLAPLQSSCQVLPAEALALSSLLASEGSCLQLFLVRGRESDSPVLYKAGRVLLGTVLCSALAQES